MRIAATRTDEVCPFFVALCGWADTGKSTLAAQLCGALKAKGVRADWISTDAFLKNRAERNRLGLAGYNPLSIDAAALGAAIERLSAQQDLVYFPYDNRAGSKVAVAKTISPESVIVIEGIHALHVAIRQHCPLRVFIDADEATLRAMRTRANQSKRGMSEVEASLRIDHELSEYRTHVLPGKRLANFSVRVSSSFEYSVQDSAY